MSKNKKDGDKKTMIPEEHKSTMHLVFHTKKKTEEKCCNQVLLKPPEIM